MLKARIPLTFLAASLFNISCTAAETTSKVKCEALGDSMIATNTGDLILEQRLIKYQELEEYGRNMTGKEGAKEQSVQSRIIHLDTNGFRAEKTAMDTPPTLPDAVRDCLK